MICARLFLLFIITVHYLSFIIHSPSLYVHSHAVHSGNRASDSIGKLSQITSNSTDYYLPAPTGPSNRVLVMLLSYGFNRFDPLLALFNSFQNMCEAGWDIDIVVFTTATISSRFQLYLSDKLFCHRIQVQTIVILLATHLHQLNYRVNYSASITYSNH